MKKKKIIVILGPTSSGKSDVAIQLAQKFNGEIISADSRQIYRGMDIGSGKVSKEEQQMAPHHMLDIISPKTDYNVAKFKKKTEKIMTEILERGRIPIICGGTGFWITALVDDVNFPEVKPDWTLREKLNKKSAHVLFRQLKKLDPQRAADLDPKNKVRTIRAIEICRALGNVPKQTENQKLKTEKYEFLQIGIDVSKEKLHQRIATRLEARFKQNMIGEVKALHRKGVSWKKLEAFGLEYRWIARYLQKKVSPEEMQEKLYFDIIHYAKRQMTWFKKDSRIHWLKNYKEIEKKVTKFIKS